MWRELLAVLSDNDPLEPIAREFHQMLNVACDMSALVKPHVFSHELSLGDRSKIYSMDIEVNKLYRTSKKERLINLIEVLDEIDGVERFRISSIEPNLLDKDIMPPSPHVICLAA